MICSGRLDGKQQTYALLEERAPNAMALTALTRRYFASHGPATVTDFAAWSSLRIADIKDALAALGDELSSIDVDGLTYWYRDEPPASLPTQPGVRILQLYDEYVMGYRESRFDEVERFAEFIGNPALSRLT